MPLPIEEKVKIIAAQHIEEEAEILSLMVLEEIEWNDKGVFKLGKIEQLLERSLDTLIYEKY